MSNNSVDAILQRMITEAKGINPDINVSKGTDTYLRFASAASAVWGLYKQTDWTLDQIFLTSMAQASLEKDAASKGISVVGLTPSEILSVLLARLRNPVSGGKTGDFERWALETKSDGKAFSLQASMLEGSFSGFSAFNLTNPHTDTIGFSATAGDEGKSLVIDLGSAQAIFGVGIGTHTSRTARFLVSHADNVGGPWVSHGSLTASFWWSMLEFYPTSARFWKLELAELSQLSSYAVPAYHAFTAYGMELYFNNAESEQPTSATVLKNFYGAGTLMTVLAPASLSMRMCEAVRAHQDYEGPVAPRELWVSVPAITTISLKVAVTGTLLSVASFRTEVRQYFAAMDAGSIFIPAQITVFAIKYGAVNAVVSLSRNGGIYSVVSDIIQAGSTELFVLGTVEML